MANRLESLEAKHSEVELGGLSEASVRKLVEDWKNTEKPLEHIKEQIERWRLGEKADTLGKYPRFIALWEAALSQYEAYKQSSNSWADKSIEQERQATPKGRAPLFLPLGIGQSGGSRIAMRQAQGVLDYQAQKADISSGSLIRPGGFSRASYQALKSGRGQDTRPFWDLDKTLGQDSPSASREGSPSMQEQEAKEHQAAPSRVGGSKAEETAVTRIGTVSRQAAKKAQDPIEISSDEEVEAVEIRATNAESELRRTTRSNAYKSTGVRFEGLKALYPPEGGKDSVQLLASDLSRLDPDEFLNDTVMDYFIKRIQVEMEHNEAGACTRMQFFNSFFFKKLTEKPKEDSSLSRHEQNHERVRNWTKGKDIFDKDFLFIPIHDHLHWSLLVVCFPASFILKDGKQTCLLLLDSMDGGHNVNSVAVATRGYLAEEWKRKTSEEGSVAWTWRSQHPEAPLPDFSAKNVPARKPSHLPRQDNYCDCGLFVLTYMHFFSYAAPSRVDPDGLQELGEDPSGYPLLLSKIWFSKENAGNLRRFLRYSILRLFIDQAPDKDAPAVVQAVVEAEAIKNVAFKYQSPQASLAENTRNLKYQQEQRMLRTAKENERKAEREAAKEEPAKRKQRSKPAASERDASVVQKAGAAATLRAGLQLHEGPSEVEYMDLSQYDFDDAEIMVDIGKESSPEGGEVFQCKGEWRRKRDPEDQEGRSPRKQSKIDNYLVASGTRASSGHRELQENELEPELSKHFKFFSRNDVNNTISFHVCFKDIAARGGSFRSFNRPEAAIEFMRSELPNLTGDAPHISEESRPQRPPKKDRSKPWLYLTDDEEDAKPASCARGRGQEARFGAEALDGFREAKATSAQGSKKIQKARQSEGCRSLDEVQTLDSEDEAPEKKRRRWPGSKGRKGSAASKAASDSQEEAAEQQKDGGKGPQGKSLRKMMATFRGAIESSASMFDGVLLWTGGAKAELPLTQLPESPPSAEKLDGSADESDYDEVVEVEAPARPRREEAGRLSAYEADALRPAGGAEPGPGRVRQQGNWSQYAELPGSAPNAVQEAAAYQQGSWGVERVGGGGCRLGGIVDYSLSGEDDAAEANAEKGDADFTPQKVLGSAAEQDVYHDAVTHLGELPGPRPGSSTPLGGPKPAKDEAEGLPAIYFPILNKILTTPAVQPSTQQKPPAKKRRLVNTPETASKLATAAADVSKPRLPPIAVGTAVSVLMREDQPESSESCQYGRGETRDGAEKRPSPEAWAPSAAADWETGRGESHKQLAAKCGAAVGSDQSSTGGSRVGSKIRCFVKQHNKPQSSPQHAAPGGPEKLCAEPQPLVDCNTQRMQSLTLGSTPHAGGPAAAALADGELSPGRSGRSRSTVKSPKAKKRRTGERQLEDGQALPS